jgi:hypothetical protein
MAEKVELHAAYQWDCPECGREIFERIIALPSLLDGSWISTWKPLRSVKCNFCKTSFSSYCQSFPPDDGQDSE